MAIEAVSGERGGGRGKAARKANCEDVVRKACEHFAKSPEKKEMLDVAKVAYGRMNKKCVIM